MKCHPILILSLLIVSLLGSFVSAATAPATVTYNRATARTDGSALAASEITAHKIVCTFTPTGGTATACALSSNTAAGSAQTFTATLTYPASGGQACFQVITVAGVDSAPSAITSASCKTFDPVAPNPPSNVTVTVTIALTLTSDSPISVAMATPIVTKK